LFQQAAELIHAKSGKGHRGPALIGNLFRQHADNGIDVQPSSPRILIQPIEDPQSDDMDSDVESDPTYQQNPLAVSITGTDEIPSQRQSSLTLHPALRRRPHQPSSLGMQSETLSRGTSLSTPSWRDNDIYQDPEATDEMSHIPHGGMVDPSLYDELPISTRSSFTGLQDTSTTSNSHEAGLSLGATSSSPIPVCVTFEEVLPHPSRGLLSRMLRLADVPVWELPGAQGPVLVLHTGQDYLITCILSHTPEDRSPPNSISLTVPGLKPQVLLLEGRDKDLEGFVRRTARWHAPEEGMLAVNRQESRPLALTAHLQIHGEGDAENGCHHHEHAGIEQQILAVFLR
jgi:hypothetical protein